MPGSPSRLPLLLGGLLCLWLDGAPLARGVILLDTGDPTRNTTTPGDNSGWQYEGQFSIHVGTPIAPRYFLTAKHIGGNVGDPFIFHGETFTTTAVFPDPQSDLQIWQVDHAFADYAPLYQSGAETGAVVRVFGRGTQRGTARTLDGTLRGWDWGGSDYVQRWGSNLVSAVETDTDGVSYLVADFDSPGIPDEAHLSRDDSGGGDFVLENGLWKLAATNYGVDILYSASGDPYYSSIFDARGYYVQDAPNHFTQVPDQGSPVPTSFYSTRVAPRLAWIAQVTGQDSATLAPESFNAWLHLYFTPDQLNDPTVVGPQADPDADGVPNLLEFAFNLDPTFANPAPLIPGTGLSGLPAVYLQTVAPADQRLTMEYVRRTAASQPGITYTAQFASDLSPSAPAAASWQTGGTETVTPLNARWERVKVTDSASVGAASARFARVLVTLTP